MKRSKESMAQPGWRVWVGFAVLVSMCVPWYFFGSGAIRPAVWAFPLWGAVVVGISVLLSIYTALVYLSLGSRDLRRKR